MEQPLIDYLNERYAKSRATQEQAKRIFDLTEREHLALWEAKPPFVTKLAAKLNKSKDSADSYMRSELGPCLSWVTKQARKDGVMNRDTAEVISHRESVMRFRMQRGEKHRNESKQKISRTKKGAKHTEARKAKVSAALIGVAKSAESNSKRSASMKAYWAKKRDDEAARKTGI